MSNSSASVLENLVSLKHIAENEQQKILNTLSFCLSELRRFKKENSSLLSDLEYQKNKNKEDSESLIKEIDELRILNETLVANNASLEKEVSTLVSAITITSNNMMTGNDAIEDLINNIELETTFVASNH